MSRSLALKWLSVLLAASLFYTMTPADTYANLPLYLALTSIAVVIWVFDLLPAVFVAAALTFAYLITNLATPEVVFSPWTTVLIWTTFGAAIFGEAMEQTGLAKRLALRCMLLTGGTFRGMLVGFGVGGIILGLLLASGFARTVIFCAIGVGIIQALELDVKSRMSSFIMLGCFFASAAPTMQFLHTSESFIWAFQILLKNIGEHVDFWEYMLHMFIPNLLYVIVCFVALYLGRGSARLPDEDVLKNVLKKRIEELGPMSSAEKRLLALALISVLGFMLEPFTGLNAVWILCIAAMFCYMPGVGIMEAESFTKLNIMFLVFVAGCMSMGAVADVCGANKWAVAAIMPYLEGLSPAVSVFCSYIAGTVANFLLTPFAATVAFTPGFGELGVQMGVNPLPLFYAFELGLDQYFFPYEGVMFLYHFTTGCVTLKHILPALGIRTILAGIILVCVWVPYWKVIGIL